MNKFALIVIAILAGLVLVGKMVCAKDQTGIILESLPYLKGYNPVPKKTGTTTFDHGLISPGINLIVTGGEPPIFLMDMEGRIIHSWIIHDSRNIRRAYVYPNGDLLAIEEKSFLAKIDKNSNLIWQLKGSYHHDLDVIDNGDIYVLTERKRKVEFPGNQTDQYLRCDILDNYITLLSPEGKVLDEISLFDCLMASDYKTILRGVSPLKYGGNVFHTNTLEVINNDYSNCLPALKKGNILVSFRNFHTIAIIDPNLRQAVWACSGIWKHQHQPTILSNGNILLFDNLGENGMSKVIEFNPSTLDIVWSYRGNDKNGFLTYDLGSQQRLANGNTLITESRDGRVFEVTQGNEIVWEFINPQITGENGNLIAVVNDCIRIDPSKLHFLNN